MLAERIELQTIPPLNLYGVARDKFMGQNEGPVSPTDLAQSYELVRKPDIQLPVVSLKDISTLSRPQSFYERGDTYYAFDVTNEYHKVVNENLSLEDFAHDIDTYLGEVLKQRFSHFHHKLVTIKETGEVKILTPDGRLAEEVYTEPLKMEYGDDKKLPEWLLERTRRDVQGIHRRQAIWTKLKERGTLRGKFTFAGSETAEDAPSKEAEEHFFPGDSFGYLDWVSDNGELHSIAIRSLVDSHGLRMMHNEITIDPLLPTERPLGNVAEIQQEVIKKIIQRYGSSDPQTIAEFISQFGEHVYRLNPPVLERLRDRESDRLSDDEIAQCINVFDNWKRDIYNMMMNGSDKAEIMRQLQGLESAVKENAEKIKMRKTGILKTSDEQSEAQDLNEKKYAILPDLPMVRDHFVNNVMYSAPKTDCPGAGIGGDFEVNQTYSNNTIRQPLFFSSNRLSEAITTRCQFCPKSTADGHYHCDNWQSLGSDIYVRCNWEGNETGKAQKHWTPQCPKCNRKFACAEDA